MVDQNFNLRGKRKYKIEVTNGLIGYDGMPMQDGIEYPKSQDEYRNSVSNVSDNVYEVGVTHSECDEIVKCSVTDAMTAVRHSRIVHLSGSSTVGIKKDRTLIATGYGNIFPYPLFQWLHVEGISNVRQVCLFGNTTLVLFENGTVTLVENGLGGYGSGDRWEFSQYLAWWEGIQYISTNSETFMAIKSDGSIIWARADILYYDGWVPFYYQDPFRGIWPEEQDLPWSSAVQVHTFPKRAVLFSNGGVYAGIVIPDMFPDSSRYRGYLMLGNNGHHWVNVIELSGTIGALIGLKANGTCYICMGNYFDAEPDFFEDVRAWTNLKQVIGTPYFCIGLKNDGTIVTAGAYWNLDLDIIESWEGIIELAGTGFVVGLREDGRCVAHGRYDYCKTTAVENWFLN